MRKSVMINDEIRSKLDKVKDELLLNTDAKALLILLELYEKTDVFPKEIAKMISRIK